MRPEVGTRGPPADHRGHDDRPGHAEAAGNDHSAGHTDRAGSQDDALSIASARLRAEEVGECPRLLGWIG
jgi:hypothetical protein